MPTKFDNLSQEVVDDILWMLHDDKATLKACSLTCRSMVQGAQRGLFSYLSVGPSPQGRQPPRLGTDVFLTMITVIPHVATYVKSLTLRCNFYRTLPNCRGLAKALPSLCHLTKFAFYRSGYNSKRTMESDLSSTIQNLLTLPTLRHVEFVDVPTDFFPYNTAVKHFAIRFDDPSAEGSQIMNLQPQPSCRKPTALESLYLGDGDELRMGIHVIDRVLECHSLDISCLTRLHISIKRTGPYDEHDIHINRLLKLCGGTLQIFKFTPSKDTNKLDEEYLELHDSREFVDLKPLQSLRVFTICIWEEQRAQNYWSYDESPEISTTFPWLLRLLKTTQKSNSIEEITIKIVHINLDECDRLPGYFLGRFPWTKFGPLFTEHFLNLRKVKFFLQAHNMTVAREIVDLEHPLAFDLFQRGILELKELQVDFSGEYLSFWDIHRIFQYLLLANGLVDSRR